MGVQVTVTKVSVRGGKVVSSKQISSKSYSRSKSKKRSKRRSYRAPISQEEREEHIVNLARRLGYPHGQLSERAREIEAKRASTQAAKPSGGPRLPTPAASTEPSPTPTGKEYRWSGESKEETPFGKLQDPKSDISRKKQEALQRVAVAAEYAPKELKKAWTGKDFEKGTERFEGVHTVALERKQKTQKAELFQRSALADLQGVGLVLPTQVGGWELTPRGQQLVKERGEEWFYQFEEQAVWGGAFDFLLQDKQVRMYPEGTRKGLKDIKEPLFFELEGKEYQLTKGTGREFLTAKEFDPYSFSLKEETRIPIASLTGGTGAYSYKVVGKELEISKQIDYSPAEATPPDPKFGFKKSPGGATVEPPPPDDPIGDLPVTPLGEFYRTKYYKGVEETLRKGEEATGLYIKESPIGEIRPASWAGGFVAEWGEAAIKAPVALGHVLGLAGGMKIREIRGVELSEKERMRALGDVTSGMEYTLQSPFFAAIAVGTAGGGATKTIAVDSITGKTVKPSPSIMKPLTTKFTKTGIEFTYKGSGTSFMPKGHPKYLDYVGKAVLTKVTGAVQPLVKPAKIAVEGAKGGALIGGIHAGADITTLSLEETGDWGKVKTRYFEEVDPSSGRTRFESTKRAFFGGALAFGTYKAYQEYKEPIKQIVDPLKQRISEKYSMGRVAKNIGREIETAYIGEKVKYMAAKTTPSALKGIPKGSPIYGISQTTLKGQNVYSYFKPPTWIQPRVMQKVKVPVPSPPSVGLFPTVRLAPTPQKAPPVSGRQRFKMKTDVPKPMIHVPLPKETFRVGLISKEITPTDIREEIVEQAVSDPREWTRLEKVQAVKRTRTLLSEGLISVEQALAGVGLGVGTGVKAGVTTGVGLHDKFRVNVGVLTKTGQKTKIRLGLRTKKIQKVPPPIILIPPFSFGLPRMDRGKPLQPIKIQGFERRTFYTPSLAGMELGKIEERILPRYTGIEIRGFPKKRKKKKKKKKKTTSGRRL